MGHDTPRQTREGRLIEAAATATGLSVKKLAANAGISDTRWRHIVKGWQPGPGGGQNPVVAPPLTLARMAFAVGVSPEDLAQTGRTDAAELLARMDESGADSVIPLPASAVGRAYDARVTINGTMEHGADEIDLIYASTSMTSKQKLERIRMVLRLRAEVEAEEAAAREKAPAADDAEAQVEQQN
jgi:hypothetical protein